MHFDCQNEEEKDWLVSNYEQSRNRVYTEESRLKFAKCLAKSQAFDHFLAKKFSTVKRYGAEGAESTMIFLNEVFAECGYNDINEVIIGMAHRGKLNVLTGILQYSTDTFFHKVLDSYW